MMQSQKNAPTFFMSVKLSLLSMMMNIILSFADKGIEGDDTLMCIYQILAGNIR
jgi:hypothetical protein